MTETRPSSPFVALAASLRASGHEAQAARLDGILSAAWTTSSELYAELGLAVLAARRECRPLTPEQKALTKQCLRSVRTAWPTFGWYDGWPFHRPALPQYADQPPLAPLPTGTPDGKPMQSISKILWGTGLAFTSLGLLLMTLQDEPAQATLKQASGVVQAVAPMKTGHRLDLGGQSFGFQLHGNRCEAASRILQLQGQTATFLYVPQQVIPAQEPPYWPLYAVYQGETPLCSYAAMRANAEREKALTRLFALGAGLLALPFFFSLWRRRPAPPA